MFRSVQNATRLKILKDSDSRISEHLLRYFSDPSNKWSKVVSNTAGVILCGPKWYGGPGAESVEKIL